MERFLDWEDDGIKRLSNGELRTFKRCAREWWLAYYRRLGRRYERPIGAAPLGTRVHACLAGWYVADAAERRAPLETLELTLEQDRALLLEAEDLEGLGELEREGDLARAMLEGYLEWLEETGADEGLLVVEPEATVEVDARLGLAQPVRLIAKLDVRAVREQDQARLFVDHKTVGSLTEPLKMLQSDQQMLHYHLCETLLLLEQDLDPETARADGAIYNMLRKVKRTANAKPPFYARFEVRHNVHELRSYWAGVRGTAVRILELTAALDAGADHQEACPPSPTGDCTWRCSYFSICRLFDDGSRVEDLLTEQYVQINPLKRYEPVE